MKLISTTLAGPGTAPIIGDALRSVAQLVDSSLVVWTGEGFGNDIFEAVVSTGVDFEIAQWRWCDDFGAARQAALDAARVHLFGDGWQLGPNDWSIMADTDERVVCPDPAALRVYLEALPADVMIVCVHTAEGTYSRERFFRSTIKARWYLRTHETIDDIDGARRVVAPRWLITWTELPKNEATIRAKCERDHAMLLRDLADHPGNGRVLFYLGNTLEHLGRYEEALVYYRQVSLLGFGEGPAWACFCAARNHLRTEPKKIEEAYAACVAAIYREPRLAEPYWLAAAICLDMGRPELALAMAQNAKVHGAGSESAEGVGGFREPFALDRGPDELIAQARAALAARRGIGTVADDVETSGGRLVEEAADGVRAILFSRDRPMQLDACLRSLRTHCRDIDKLDVCVIVRWTSKEFEQAYGEVDAANPWANFVCEVDFETDTRSLLAGAGYDHVMFVVDDTVFVRPFAVAEMVADLEADPGAIGYSLRLGANMTWSYPANRAQAVPETVASSIGGTPLALDWTTADGDFGYPLDVSSSLYRTADVRAAIPTGVHFGNPNELESTLARCAVMFGDRPRLLCAPLSLAFSVPCNRVQSTYANRVGDDADLSADALLRLWQDGWRIDVAALAGHTPRACHEEVAYAFERRTGGADWIETFTKAVAGLDDAPPAGRLMGRFAPLPISITVTSTGYRAAEWAGRCIESVERQTLRPKSHVYVAADLDTWRVALYSSADNRHGEGDTLLANLLPIWRSLPPDEVIVWLDGDDWLASDHALERVAAAHRAGALVTYGSFMYADGRPCIAGPCGDDPRSEPWRSSHLKSFRAGLVQRIRESDWRCGDGSWLDLSIDQAVMLPCLEMAGRDRSVYIPEILCVYNYAHSFGANADAVGLAREAEALRMVRGRPRYERIGGL